MFFDLAQDKVRFLSFVASTLVVLVIAFILVERSYAVVEIGSDFSHRVLADTSYRLRYGGPDHLIAAAGSILHGEPTTAVAAGTATGIPVLLYHGEGGGAPMSEDTFVGELRALHDAGWHTITLEQFRAFMKDGAPLPAKSFLLTFDDGRRDTFYATDPILKDYGYTAVMFVITGFSLPDVPSRSSFYLSKTELTYMENSGRWELESHGAEDHRGYDVPSATSTPPTASTFKSQHFMSNLFWLPTAGRLETKDEYTSRVTNDLLTAKKTLEDDFGKTVTAYAFPFNDFGQDGANFPASEGILTKVVPSIYEFAFYQTWPGNGDALNYPDKNQYLVKRIEPGPTWSGEHLLSVLSGTLAKQLPYTADSIVATDWDTNWGVVKVADHALSIAALPSTTGGTAFLNGSGFWKNYRVTASVSSLAGTVSLLARYQDTTAPYPVCAFADDRMYLERHSGGIHDEIKSALYHPSVGSRMVSMSVDGSTITCSSGGSSITADVSGLLDHGGAGIEVWDPEFGAGRMEVTAFSASAL